MDHSELKSDIDESPLEQIRIDIDEIRNASGNITTSIQLSDTEYFRKSPRNFWSSDVLDVSENVQVNIQIQDTESEQCLQGPISIQMQDRTKFSPDAETEYQNIISVKITHAADESGYQSPTTNISPSNFNSDSDLKNRSECDDGGKFQIEQRMDEKSIREKSKFIVSRAIAYARYRLKSKTIVNEAITCARNRIRSETQNGAVFEEGSNTLVKSDEVHRVRIPQVTTLPSQTTMDVGSCNVNIQENISLDLVCTANKNVMAYNDRNSPAPIEINLTAKLLPNAEVGCINVNETAVLSNSPCTLPRNFEFTLPCPTNMSPGRVNESGIQFQGICKAENGQMATNKTWDEISATLSLAPSLPGKSIEISSSKPPRYNQERRHAERKCHRHHRHHSEHKEASESVGVKKVVGHCTLSCPSSWSSSYSGVDSYNIYPYLSLSESLAMSSKMLTSYIESLKRGEKCDFEPYGEQAFDKLVTLVKRIVCKSNVTEPNTLPLDLNKCDALQKVLEQELNKFSEVNLIDELGRLPKKSEITVVVSNRKE